MRPEQEKKIRQHGENLQAIFPTTKDMDPVKLCKALRLVENSARRAAVRWCNGEIDEFMWDRYATGAIARCETLLRIDDAAAHGIFINSDGRGYALKIDDDYMREHKVQLERDMGGYGIIAPEIN